MATIESDSTVLVNAMDNLDALLRRLKIIDYYVLPLSSMVSFSKKWISKHG